MLPSSAPSEVKVQLRQAVEEALVRYGPEDAQEELQDLIRVLVQEVTRRMADTDVRRQREEQKKTLLSCADSFLVLALNQCPAELVGVRNSALRRTVLVKARRDLHDTLSAELTGEESAEVLMEKVGAWVAAWMIAQNPTIERRTFFHEFRKWIGPAALMACGVAVTVPQVRATLGKGLRGIAQRLASHKDFFEAALKMYTEGRPTSQDQHGPTEHPKGPSGHPNG
jgi:hypothetical protein